MAPRFLITGSYATLAGNRGAFRREVAAADHRAALDAMAAKVATWKRYAGKLDMSALQIPAAKNWPADRVPVFVECGCCGHLHRPTFTGDCRDDSERFTESDIEDRFGNSWLISGANPSTR